MNKPPHAASSPTERPHRIRLRVWTKHGTYARYEAGTICWNECDAIERNPDRMRGAWRFKGTGVPLANLFHALAAGSTTTELVETNDGVEETAPATVLEFIAEQLDDAKEALWRYGGPRTATPPLLDGGKENRDAEHDPKTTHWKDCGAAWRDAERMTGSWCIKDTRFPLSQLFTNLADEQSVRELVDIYQITTSNVLPVLQFLAEDLDRVLHATRDRNAATQATSSPGDRD